MWRLLHPLTPRRSISPLPSLLVPAEKRTGLQLCAAALKGLTPCCRLIALRSALPLRTVVGPKCWLHSSPMKWQDVLCQSSFGKQPQFISGLWKNPGIAPSCVAENVQERMTQSIDGNMRMLYVHVCTRLSQYEGRKWTNSSCLPSGNSLTVNSKTRHGNSPTCPLSPT